VGLKSTLTGHTLCDEKSSVILEAMTFPEPVISVAIEPRPRLTRKNSASRFRSSCRKTLVPRVHRSGNGQTIISGMGELHLEIIVDRLMREFKVDANVVSPGRLS